MEELNEKIPSNLNKLVLKLGSITEKMQLQKQNMDEISHELKAFEKLIGKLIKKHLKIEQKEKAPRKKCGFALPTQSSASIAIALVATAFIIAALVRNRRQSTSIEY